MKKFLLTATMLVAFTALSKAQQGRVGINTSTPAATLDVVASTTDTSRPDALLVPRMSRAQLLAKDAAYADGNATAASAQNGALVFVNLVDGTATTKTANVTATGFYYYDGTNGNNVWKPVGGGGGTDTSIYLNDGTLAGNRVVTQNNNNLTFTTGTGRTIVNGNFETQGGVYGSFRTLTAVPTAATWLPTDYMVTIQVSGNQNIELPTPAAAGAGRILMIRNASVAAGGSGTYTFINNVPVNNTSILASRGVTLLSTGTSWLVVSGV